MRRATKKAHSRRRHHPATPALRHTRRKVAHLTLLRKKERTLEDANRKANNIVSSGAQDVAYGLEMLALPFTWMLSLAIANLPHLPWGEDKSG